MVHVPIAEGMLAAPVSRQIAAQLRYERGEAMASEMWQKVIYCDEVEPSRIDFEIESHCKEIVAIGVVVPGVAGLVWYRLENEADEPWHKFDISDSQMRVVIADIVKQHPRAQAHVLWHSHYEHNEPSGHDISTFPEWLVGVGVVYHAPTSTSHAYDQSGVVSTA